MSIKKTSKLSKLISKFEDVKIELEELQNERQNHYDSKSERWQESEAGTNYSDDNDALDDILNEVNSAFDNLENLLEED